jgi:exosortase/archaeosortase family protein
MKLKDILHNRKNHIFFASLLILLLVYLALKIIFPGSFSLTQLLADITNPYLILVEKFANFILQRLGSSLIFQNHIVTLNGIPIDGFVAQIMYKKFTLFYILVLWFTKSFSWEKILFTILYLAISFIAVSFYNVAEAFSLTGISYNNTLISTIHGVVIFLLNTLLLIWYWINKGSSSESSTTASGITKLLARKLFDIILLIYVYAILLFSIDHFDFNLLIEFILKSSQKILGILGYGSLVKDNLLIGQNGSISLARPCLGIMTLFYFAALLYLTSKQYKKVWVYIIIGLLVLNIANIIRIVTLFIYIQKNGTDLALDVHDMFTYITYFIVFILWVIWFEKFMNIRGKKKA